MWESKIWGRWVSWFISCGHGTVSHQLQFSADVLQKWRDILWSKFANVSLMFFATYLQIFIPFYLVVLAAVTFLHITESPCRSLPDHFWCPKNDLVVCQAYPPLLSEPMGKNSFMTPISFQSSWDWLRIEILSLCGCKKSLVPFLWSLNNQFCIRS